MFLSRALAWVLYWTAQGALPLGRLGARLAHGMLWTALAFDPRLPRARGWQLLIEGTFARERGDMAAAVPLLRQAEAELPDNDVVAANLGIALAMAGRHEEALAAIERALRRGAQIGGEPQVWVALAWSYLRTGRAPKALEACRRAAESQALSREVEGLRLLALAAGEGSWDRGEVQALLRLRPRIVPLALDLAQYLAQGGGHRAARDIVECLPSAVQTRAFAIIARSALNGDDPNTALWALKELERREPTSPTPATTRSEIALRRGNLDAALSHVREALERDPANPEALEQLVRLHLVRGEWAEATEVAERAVGGKSAGALSAGVAGLRLVEVGQAALAQRLFTTTRSGDRFACAFAHAAQALVFAHRAARRQALHAARQAIEDLAQLASWERTPAITDRLAEAVGEALALIGAADDPVLRAKLAEAREGGDGPEA